MSTLNTMPNNYLPKRGAKVVVAMSGGVDSSVTAGFLKESGYDVIGISLQLHDMNEKEDNKYGSCCSLSDISDARRVAEKIGVPFYVNNMEDEFNESVITDFVSEYLAGRTPNPCVKCNEKVKFSRLLNWALDLGADFLATGHYARMTWNSDSPELHKGDDPDKDQSYFLFTLKERELRNTVFPVGTFAKPVVRELAQKYGLAVYNKPDSQEICFVQGRSYKDFIEATVPKEQLIPGVIKDRNGKEIGHHNGLYQFTIGQRKGIPVHSLEPLYVLQLNPSDNSLIVGPETDLFRRTAIVNHINWINFAPNEKGSTFEGKVRYRAKASPVWVEPLSENSARVTFEIPQRAVTPGQALVFYDGTRVAGGGWISELPLQ